MIKDLKSWKINELGLDKIEGEGWFKHLSGFTLQGPSDNLSFPSRPKLSTCKSPRSRDHDWTIGKQNMFTAKPAILQSTSLLHNLFFLLLLYLLLTFTCIYLLGTGGFPHPTENDKSWEISHGQPLPRLVSSCPSSQIVGRLVRSAAAKWNSFEAAERIARNSLGERSSKMVKNSAKWHKKTT